jgi:serine/threonine-protein kinase
MEYVHGETLARLSSGGDKERIPLPIATAIVCGALHGLHAAHEAKDDHGEPLGLVHRDVSPQNIMVGVDGVARVLDFGVAKAAGRLQSTAEGQVKGKIPYMSPEQLRGVEVTRQADIYAASVVLWELLVGQRLFQAVDAASTLERVLFAPIAAPCSLVPSVPKAVDAVVMRGLSRERSRRYSTAKEMALALEAALPPASPSQVGEWVEARALEALERRAQQIAEMTSRPSEKVPAPIPPLSAAADGETSIVSVSPEQRIPSSTRRRAAPAWLAAALVASALIAWFALYRMRTPAPVVVATPSAPTPVDLSAPLPTTSSDEVAPQVPLLTRAPSAATMKLVAPPQPKRGQVSAARDRPSTPSPPPVRSSNPGLRCASRTADGLIEFDTECLRRTKSTP